MDNPIVKDLQDDLALRAEEHVSGETSQAAYELTPDLKTAIEWAHLGGD